MKAPTLFRFTKPVRLVVTSFLVFAGMTLAQESEPVLDRPSRLSDPTLTLPMTPSPVLETITLFPDASEDMSLEPEIDKHPWKFVLHGNATATYNDNIFISHSNKQEDFIFTIAPGVAIGRGEFRNELASLGSYEARFNPDRSDILAVENYIFVHYVPSVTLFADNSSENSFDHDVTLDGQYEWKRLTIGLKARYQTMNLPDADLGERVERELFTGALTSKYDLTGKTSIELNFFTYIRDNAGDRIDSTEFRDVHGLANRTNGIFSLGVSYLPFAGTSVDLQGYRRTVTSANFPPANYDITGVEAQFRQRFAKRFYFAAAGGYQNVGYEYFASASQRTDEVYYIHPSSGMDITSWLSCEVGAQFRRNDSTQQKNDYSETTVDLQFNAFF